MKQIEVMQTKTRWFNDVAAAMEYIVMMENDGWAVRQIEMVSLANNIVIFVVLEDNV
jgi:hypothetical protein